MTSRPGSARRLRAAHLAASFGETCDVFCVLVLGCTCCFVLQLYNNYKTHNTQGTHTHMHFASWVRHHVARPMTSSASGSHMAHAFFAPQDSRHNRHIHFATGAWRSVNGFCCPVSASICTLVGLWMLRSDGAVTRELLSALRRAVHGTRYVVCVGRGGRCGATRLCCCWLHIGLLRPYVLYAYSLPSTVKP